MEKAASPASGAISVFVGTTRTPYRDKEVMHLEYQCYEKMAIKTMGVILHKSKSQFDILNVCIQHRTGVVCVGEASVVVVVTSVHRADAYRANEWIMNEIKKTVPIWKKEIYVDGEIWKENSECNIMPSHS